VDVNNVDDNSNDNNNNNNDTLLFLDKEANNKLLRLRRDLDAARNDKIKLEKENKLLQNKLKALKPIVNTNSSSNNNDNNDNNIAKVSLGDNSNIIQRYVEQINRLNEINRKTNDKLKLIEKANKNYSLELKTLKNKGNEVLQKQLFAKRQEFDILTKQLRNQEQQFKLEKDKLRRQLSELNKQKFLLIDKLQTQKNQNLHNNNNRNNNNRSSKNNNDQQTTTNSSLSRDPGVPPKIVVKEKLVLQQYRNSISKLRENREKLSKYLSKNPKYDEKIQELEKKLKALEDSINDEIMANDGNTNNKNEKSKSRRNTISNANNKMADKIIDEQEKDKNNEFELDWELSQVAIDMLVNDNNGENNNNDEENIGLEALLNELENKEKVIFELQDQIENFKQQQLSFQQDKQQHPLLLNKQSSFNQRTNEIADDFEEDKNNIDEEDDDNKDEFLTQYLSIRSAIEKETNKENQYQQLYSLFNLLKQRFEDCKQSLKIQGNDNDNNTQKNEYELNIEKIEEKMDNINSQFENIDEEIMNLLTLPKINANNSTETVDNDDEKSQMPLMSETKREELKQKLINLDNDIENVFELISDFNENTRNLNENVLNDNKIINKEKKKNLQLCREGIIDELLGGIANVDEKTQDIINLIENNIENHDTVLSDMRLAIRQYHKRSNDTLYQLQQQKIRLIEKQLSMKDDEIQQLRGNKNNNYDTIDQETQYLLQDIDNKFAISSNANENQINFMAEDVSIVQVPKKHFHYFKMQIKCQNVLLLRVI